ncbi:hypothetical protein YC2023_038381 [Brassica napus]
MVKSPDNNIPPMYLSETQSHYVKDLPPTIDTMKPPLKSRERALCFGYGENARRPPCIYKIRGMMN